MDLLNDDFYDFAALDPETPLSDDDLYYPMLGIYTAETREARLNKYRLTRSMLNKKPRIKKKYDMLKKVRSTKGKFVKI